MFKTSQKINNDGTVTINFKCSNIERNLFGTEVFDNMVQQADGFYSGWDYTAEGIEIQLDFSEVEYDLNSVQRDTMFNVINEVINETPSF